MNILQVNTYDVAGGAEKVAGSLNCNFREIGHESFLAVGEKRSLDKHVYQIENDRFRSRWAKKCMTIAKIGFLQRPDKFASRFLRTWIIRLGEPKRYINDLLGHDDFDYPGTERLLNGAPIRPDILHCHNLHGGYFSLRALPALNKQVPIVLTLHDAWLLSGHCAHSFSCERWRIGCGHCPDLSIYQQLRRDGTSYNFRQKQAIYNQCRLNIATPSKWLMEKVRQSMLATSMASSCVIPNGISLDTFRSGDRLKARNCLGLDPSKDVLLFTANTIQRNPWKDFKTMHAAMEKLSTGREILFLALGESSPPEKIGNCHIQFIPYIGSEKEISQYYQAADLYIHAAREETFPLSILEALACGTPVVATSVGGIPEIVRNLDGVFCSDMSNSFPLQSATGLLVSMGNADALAHCIEFVLKDKRIREQLAHNAAIDAKNRFDIRKQAASYLEWYEEIIAHNKKGMQPHS